MNAQHPSRRIICIGEVVFDIVFRENKPADALPGGSIFNTAISLSRLGLYPYIVTRFTDDEVGKIVLGFLKKNKVNPDYITIDKSGLTPVSLAFLDKSNNAKYSFYKIPDSGASGLIFPEIKENDIIIFGSFYGFNPQIRKNLVKFLGSAIKNNCIIIYDPNYRSFYSHQFEKIKDMIFENFSLADITKGSTEDFRAVFKTPYINKVWSEFPRSGNNNLIVTAAHNDTTFFNDKFTFKVKVPQINPLSTIGAGDAFTAGIASKIAVLGILKQDLPHLTKSQWSDIISFASECAAVTCMERENYIPVSNGKVIRKRVMRSK